MEINEDTHKWMGGFIDAKGSFRFIRNCKGNITPVFSIGVNPLYKDTLHYISSLLGESGGIFEDDVTSSLKIRRLKNITKLIFVFDRCHFFGKKREIYLLWKEGINLILKEEKTDEEKHRLTDIVKIVNRNSRILKKSNLAGIGVPSVTAPENIAPLTTPEKLEEQLNKNEVQVEQQNDSQRIN